MYKYSIKQHLWNILLAVDYLANAIAGGDPEETISQRLGREYPHSFLRKFVDFLFGKGHCEKANQTGTNGKAVIK